MIRNTEEQGTRRERKRQARTDQIIDSALRLAGDLGLEGLTIQRLAVEVDAAVGALYRYFPSKDALLAAMQRQVIEAFAEDLGTAREQMLALMGQAVAETAPALLARALLGPWLYWTLPVRSPVHFRLITQMIGDPRDLLPQAEAMPNVAAMLELASAVAEPLEAAAIAGALEPGDILKRTLLLWAGLHGLMQLRKLSRFAPELLGGRAPFDELARTLLKGWGAKTEDLDRALAMLDAAGLNVSDNDTRA